VYTFFNGKYLLDILYNNVLISGGLELGYIVSKVIDRGIIETLGPQGLSTVLTKTSVNVGKLDTGIVTSYALYIVLGLISLLFLLFSPFLEVFSSSDPANSLSNLSPNNNLSEIRLIVIYLASLVLLNSKSPNTTK
jgi:NADH-ubiquinone oxidoreductase chain 5